jgi:hypothetical protein
VRVMIIVTVIVGVCVSCHYVLLEPESLPAFVTYRLFSAKP